MSAQIPPWLEEQIKNHRQTYSNLQKMVAQIQQLDMEKAETENALAELNKAGETDEVYRMAGSIMVKVDRESANSYLEEQLQLVKTKSDVLSRQKNKIAANLKEQEARINEAMRGAQLNPQ